MVAATTPPTVSIERRALVKQARKLPRAIQFPKETSALRQYVADVQASAAKVTPTRFRIRLSPPEIAAEGRPRPSETLRQRVDQARRATAARNEPLFDERGPGDENARVDRQARAGLKLESAAAVGRLVRERRREAGMSQGQLALTAGTGRRFISELEAGKPSAELGKVLMVCRALGVHLFAESGSHER
jgi:y4mF family transcriptional regulator